MVLATLDLADGLRDDGAIAMKTVVPIAALAFLVAAGPAALRGEEAHASLYVVDRSEEFAETGGACLPYSPEEKAGPSREILAIAKGLPGSTIFMIAFDRDAPYLGLAPVLVEQTEDSKPARFPGEGGVWPYERTPALVELFVAVFDKADPELAKIAEYAEWLGDALKEKNEVEALLHAEVIKKRLSNLLRQRSVDDYRVKFGDGLSSLRLPPSSKAAVTRGTPSDPLLDPSKREPKASLAAVRRGLKTLDEEWREDSRPIPYGLASPGILVFPVTPPPAP